MKRPVSVTAARHLLEKLAEYRVEVQAKFPEPTYSGVERESFALAMLEGTLQHYADPL